MTDSNPGNAGAIAAEWWRKLNPEDGAQTGPQRAALAHLRRAGTPLEAMREAAALRLIQRLPHRDADRVAALAGILAWVREDNNRRVARIVGRESLDKTEAVLSEGRFRRLMQVEGNEQLMDAMRRLVHLAPSGAVNVGDLSGSILYWGDRVRKRWIFDYYGVGLAAPSAPSTPPQGDPAA